MKIYRVYFRYKNEANHVDNVAGAEYFWKFSAPDPSTAKRRALKEFEDQIEVLEVVETKVPR